MTVDPVGPRRRLLVSLCAAGFVTLGVLGFVAWQVTVPKVERHLHDDVSKAVGNDVENLRVDVDGTRVVLSGTVKSAAQRKRVALLVRQRWGVSSVDSVALRTARNTTGSNSLSRRP